MRELYILRSSIATLVLLAVIAIPAHATVTTIGNVDPGVSGTQSDAWTLDEALYVGKTNGGMLNITAGGVVSNTKGYIGYKSGSSGEATIVGTDSQWYNSGNLYVGVVGSGVLDVKGKGMVSSVASYIGYHDGSMGQTTITGPSTQWINSGDLNVGVAGDGVMNIKEGALASNSNGRIGYHSSAMGQVTVAGADSWWNNSGRMVVGRSGNGVLIVEASGVVSNGLGIIGRYSSSTGAVTVTGTNSQWNNSAALYVGWYGDGVLELEEGSVVSNASGFIGRYAESTGVVTVTGADSQWRNSNSLYIGGGTLAAGGHGILNIKDSARVIVSNSTKIWSTGTVNLNGGILDAGTLDLTEGVFDMLDGHLHADGVIGDLDVHGGVVAPGNSSSMTSISGNYVQRSNATLEIELGETSDQLLVDGNASIDGELSVELLGDFTPDHGDQFPVITAGTRDGEFDAIDGIQVAADLTLAPIYDYADHIGLVLIAASPGDANFDGSVDVADLGIVGANFTADDMQWDTGDFSLDSMTDVADLGLLGANWTASQATGNASALVPEPTTLSLLAMSVLVVRRGWC